MFRDSAQRSEACRALLARVGLDRFWSSDGPLPTAWEQEEPLSSGEAVMLRASLDVWNGSGHCKLARALDVLDPDNLAAIGSLLVAISRGGFAVDRWIAEQRAATAQGVSP